MTEWILYPILMHYMSTMALFGMESWRDDGGDDGRGKGAELDAGRWWRMRRKKKRKKKKTVSRVKENDSHGRSFLGFSKLRLNPSEVFQVI